MLEIGAMAPDFTLPDQQGVPRSLSEFRGKKVVLYFYPKDNTPGCTRQACAYQKAWTDFQDKNTMVIGVSRDGQKSHQSFIEKYQLPFLLLSDADHQVTEKFGAWQEKIMYGKTSMGVVRCTYLIDESGRVEKVYPKAKPDTNAEEIVKYLGLSPEG